MVSALDSGSDGPSSSPGQRTALCSWARPEPCVTMQEPCTRLPDVISVTLSILEYMYMRRVTRKSLPETSEVERQPTKHQHIDQGRPKIDDPIHNPNFQSDRIRKPGQNFQLTCDPRYFSNPRIRSIFRRNPQSVSFLRPNPPIRGPIQPPRSTVLELASPM